MPETERPHLAFPFGRDSDGRVKVVEQDAPEHVMACENVIVRCPVGFREEFPEFGWPFPTFQPAPLDVAPLTEAMRRFEPRGNASGTEYADQMSAAIRHMTIDVEVEGG